MRERGDVFDAGFIERGPRNRRDADRQVLRAVTVISCNAPVSSAEADPP
jgi:hypothetical protein